MRSTLQRQILNQVQDDKNEALCKLSATVLSCALRGGAAQAVPNDGEV